MNYGQILTTGRPLVSINIDVSFLPEGHQENKQHLPSYIHLYQHPMIINSISSVTIMEIFPHRLVTLAMNSDYMFCYDNMIYDELNFTSIVIGVNFIIIFDFINLPLLYVRQICK